MEYLKLSPAAALRPLWQESVLNSLIFVGGPSEISYWLEVKELFRLTQVNHPILVLRQPFSFINCSVYRSLKNSVPSKLIWQDHQQLKLTLARNQIKRREPELLNLKMELFCTISRLINHHNRAKAMTESIWKKLYKKIFQNYTESSNLKSLTDQINPERERKVHILQIANELNTEPGKLAEESIKLITQKDPSKLLKPVWRIFVKGTFE